MDFLHAGMPGHLPQHATIAAAHYQHLPGRILQHLTALQSLLEHKVAVCAYCETFSNLQRIFLAGMDVYRGWGFCTWLAFNAQSGKFVIISW